MRVLRVFIALIAMCILIPRIATASANQQQNGELHINDEQLTYSINAHMDVLVDPQKQWSLKDVQSPTLQQQFQPANGKSSFGYSSSVYWVRIAIQNDSSISKWEMSVQNPLIDKMEMYGPGEVAVFHRHYPAYTLNIPLGQLSTIYLRVETFGAMLLPIRLTEPSVIYDNIYDELLLYGIYNGMLLIIVVFQLVLFLYTRNIAYFYYIFNAIAFWIALLIWNGLAIPFFGTGHLTGQTAGIHFWDSPSSLYDFFYVLGRWFGCLFIAKMLLPKSYSPVSDFICRVLNIVSPIVCVGILFFYPLGMSLFVFWFKYVTLLLALFVLILCSLKGNRTALYLAIPNILLVLIAVLPKALLLYGLFPDNLFTHYASQFGLIGNFIFTTIVLYALMNQMRKKEEKAQQTLIETLENWNVALKQTVAEQTKNLKRTNDELIVVEATRTKLLQNISHDVRGPLSYVQSGIQAMIHKFETRPEHQEQLLRKVHDKVLDINQYIDDFLELSRNDGGQWNAALQMVMFYDWIEEIFEELAEDIEYDGHFSKIMISNFESDADVLLDPHLIKRVLSNLVHNACKFTSPGGTITLEASMKSSSVMVMVGDTGNGIGAEQVKHIFRRYYKEAEARGSGLGLAIAKEIVEGHGGEIWAESVQGQGSKFYFTLPMVGAES